MTHRNRHNEKDKQRQTMPQADMSQRKEPQPTNKPSQAEGDRQTVEESISQKEDKGQL